MKILFISLLVLHGLIHLMGFTKAFDFAPMSALSGDTLFPMTKSSKPIFGSLWLIACLLFLWTAVAYFLEKSEWWMPAAAAILLSQFLIVVYWQDAKAGTIANFLILLVALAGFGNWKNEGMIRAEISAIFSKNPPAAATIVNEEMLVPLPLVVQNWLRQSGVLGKPLMQTVQLHQKGLMRTKPAGKWLETAAVQYFRTAAPAFVWDAEVKMMPGVYFSGRDKLQDGKGNMLIKLLSLYPIVDGRGDKIDQGTLLRFLGEMVWFPSAALSPYISWEAAGDNAAKATLRHAGLEVSGIFTFDELGRPIEFSAERYFGSGEEAKLEKWYVPMRAWKTFDGITIPGAGDVVWRLPEGDYNYFQWEITDIEYDRPLP